MTACPPDKVEEPSVRRVGNAALSRFLKRLQLGVDLTGQEQDAILGLDRKLFAAPPRRDLVRPGQTVDRATLVADGLLARYDLMRDGARQITALHIPGDMCDLHSVVAPTAGWGLTALCPSTVLHVPHTALRRAATEHLPIATAFWRDTVLDASILAKGIANIGRRNSRSRIAHLLCELGIRMERAGIGSRLRYPLPASQEQIADMTGLTGVHVNRMLRELRTDGLASFERPVVEIHDWDRLVNEADFTTAYLL